MPTWGELLQELQASAPQPGGPVDLDGVREKYIRQLHEVTGRPVIVYATDWLGGNAPH